MKEDKEFDLDGNEIDDFFDNEDFDDENFDDDDLSEEELEEIGLDYDEEEILDTMFPDRHDEDFDQDNISWDSVFGDD